MNTPLILLLTLSLIGLVFAQQPYAVAVLTKCNTASPPNLQGTVTFSPAVGGNVTVTVYVTGLDPIAMLYGIHIHQYGDLTDTVAGMSSGSHWNPLNSPHGCPEFTDNRHYGDMGNWNCSASGVINQSKSLDLLTLTGGLSIVGRGVQLHNMTDDCLNTSATGNAGVRLGLGVVGLTNPGNTGNAGNTNNTASNTNTSIPLLVAYLTATSVNPDNSSTAVIFFEPNNNNSICGVNANIYMFGQFSGVAYLNSKHGLHIYNFGDLTSSDGTSLGYHYNFTGELHNLPVNGDTNNKHQGDLGNVKNQYLNTSVFSRCDNYIKYLYSLIGRGIGLHADFDHGNGSTCDQDGNSGQLYLVGVIGIANVGFNQTNIVSNATQIAISLSDYDNSVDTSITCFISPPPTSSHHSTNSASKFTTSTFVFLCVLMLALFL